MAEASTTEPISVDPETTKVSNASRPGEPPSGYVSLQPASSSGCGCGGANGDGPPIFVYALGRIKPQFPRVSVEKEFAQATGRGETAGLTNGESLQKILSDRQNRYLARQLCWVFTIEGQDTYLLHARDPLELEALINSLRPNPRGTDVDLVIGVKGPIAPPDFCNSLQLPIVAFDQLYSFDVDSLIKGIKNPNPEKFPKAEFAKSAESFFHSIQQMADNAGATDDTRAVNYLAVRYNQIYAKVAEMFVRDYQYDGFSHHPSRLSGARRIVDVVFSFTSRATNVTEKYFVRVDVTDEFPFLASNLMLYVDR